ncbi:MAG TPA: ATP-binding cassette domain-containing protein [Candidatus Blautia faecipullorum]|nr:ATP-binding cassette domain-containing protein [Candidatus Blautia faecipullorum]
MLVLENVSWKASDGEEILRDISLEIPDGKMTVITGPNGGGKTSLAKLIAGLVDPTEGRILLDGEDITGWDMTERARGGISFAFQQPVRFKGLTVRDLLEISAERKLDSGEVCRYLGEVGLCAEEYIDRVVDASLSGGEGKRIEIASVLARKNVKLRVFDEPEAGIDLWSFTNLIDVFQRLKNKDSEALLVISHQERILEIADRIVVVDNGKIRIAGDRQVILPRLLAQEKAARCPKEEERSCAR